MHSLEVPAMGLVDGAITALLGAEPLQRAGANGDTDVRGRRAVLAVADVEAEDLAAPVGADSGGHTTACAATRAPRPRWWWPPTRALQKQASRNTYGNATSVNDRSRNAATSTSRSAQIRDTSVLEIPVCAPIAATRSSTLRVDPPCT
jgi:hypothetical protein